MTPDEITTEAFDLLHGWQDNKTKLHFEFNVQPDSSRTFQVVVRVFSVRDDQSSITLDWRRQAIDPADNFLFVEGQGYFGVMVKDATFRVDHDPKSVITISRGPFRCSLTELPAA